MSNGNLVFAEYGAEAFAKPNYQSAGPGLSVYTQPQLAVGVSGPIGFNSTTINAFRPDGSATISLSSLIVYGATTISGVLTASSSITMNTAGTFTLAPPGAGTGTINPGTLGSINNMTLGLTTPANAKVTFFTVTYTDHGATASPVATTTMHGRVRIPIAGSSVQVTNASITALCQVIITQRQLDTTLTRAIAVAAAGSFTITGNAAATADTDFDYTVIYG